MPRYQFAIDRQDRAPEVDWLPGDLTALKLAAKVASELGRNCRGPFRYVIAMRLSRPPSPPETVLGCVMPTLAARRIMAERHVHEGRRILSRQRRLIASLRPSSKMLEAAEILLSAFERSQATFEADLADIIKAQAPP